MMDQGDLACHAGGRVRTLNQQEMAAAEIEARTRRTIESSERADKKSQREMLLMDRMRIERDLTNARHDRHREMLRDALRHLDEKLKDLD